MALDTLTAALRLNACGYFGTGPRSSNILHMYSANLIVKPLAVEAKANTRTESAKILNRRQKKKAIKPRLSVFCPNKQLYAMLVDDQNKKCLFNGSTRNRFGAILLVEAAERVGEELIKSCISQYR